MNRLLTRNDAKYRLIRTIIQGIIGVVIANLDLMVGAFSIPDEYRPAIAAFVMAILSPVMSIMGTDSLPEKDDIPHGYFENEEETDGDSE